MKCQTRGFWYVIISLFSATLLVVGKFLCMTQARQGNLTSHTNLRGSNSSKFGMLALSRDSHPLIKVLRRRIVSRARLIQMQSHKIKYHAALLDNHERLILTSVVPPPPPTLFAIILLIIGHWIGVPMPPDITHTKTGFELRAELHKLDTNVALKLVAKRFNFQLSLHF